MPFAFRCLARLRLHSPSFRRASNDRGIALDGAAGRSQSLTINHLIPTPNSQSQPPIDMMAVARKVTLITDCRIWFRPNFEPQLVRYPIPATLCDLGSYTKKELQRGILSGFESSTSCYNSTLTIDKNTNRVYLSFTRTKAADNYDRIKSGTCAAQPRTHVLMNCTGWARSRKGGSAPPRYCDFSNSSSK
jgi:hypothetical protein